MPFLILTHPRRNVPLPPSFQGRPSRGTRWLPAAMMALLVLVPGWGRRGAGGQDAPGSGGISAEDLEKSVVQVMARMEDQPLEEVWRSTDLLTRLGKEVIPVLRRELPRSGERARMGCARALIQLGDAASREEAITALVRLVESTRNLEIKVASIQLLGEHGDPEKIVEFLRGILDTAIDPALVIPLCRTLWDLDNVPEARTKLIELLKSRDPAVKKSAALALAEIAYFEGEVRDLLRELRREPSPEGRLAAALYHNDQLARQLDRSLDAGEAVIGGADPKILLREKEKKIRELESKIEDLELSRPRAGGRFQQVIEEVLALIEKFYVNPELHSRRDLIIAAVKGIARSLDEFSSFLDPDETMKFMTEISGEYCGIGAQVGKPAKDAPLEVLKPIYGGPAHDAGILTGDQILEVNGITTDDHPQEEIVNRLKGSPGSMIRLKVYRRGWMEPREFELTRRTIEVPSLYSEMLPGQIGIIKLNQFGERAADEFEAAVLGLEGEGMKALIIDLRNNPGGLLKAAVKIVDLFVGEEDRPIVTQRGRNSDDEELSFPSPSKRPDYPIVMVVNGRSASASEIVSGALKDYHRATIVGQRTFGKGSVQKLLPLSDAAQELLGGEVRMRMTVKYYYLPSGRCIHTVRDLDGKVIPGKEGGVEPDITVEPETGPAWLLEEIEKIRSARSVIDYVERHFEEIKGFIIDGDGKDPQRYPQFDELYKSLDTRATPDQVRQIIRYSLRRRVEDAMGKELACDFQEDVQLLRAIREILIKLGTDPEQVPQYKDLLK